MHLQEVDFPTLNSVGVFLAHLTKNPPPKVDVPIRSNNMAENVDCAWASSFVDQFDVETLCKLMHVFLSFLNAFFPEKTIFYYVFVFVTFE